MAVNLPDPKEMTLEQMKVLEEFNRAVHFSIDNHHDLYSQIS